MQSAETVLGVLRDRGRKGLPCNELYRQMFNRDLYLLAYGRIYTNQGAMTPGVLTVVDFADEAFIENADVQGGVGRRGDGVFVTVTLIGVSPRAVGIGCSAR